MDLFGPLSILCCISCLVNAKASENVYVSTMRFGESEADTIHAYTHTLYESLMLCPELCYGENEMKGNLRTCLNIDWENYTCKCLGVSGFVSVDALTANTLCEKQENWIECKIGGIMRHIKKENCSYLYQGPTETTTTTTTELSLLTWLTWGPWHPCNVDCGVGTIYRQRSCVGINCIDVDQENGQCDTGIECLPNVIPTHGPFPDTCSKRNKTTTEAAPYLPEEQMCIFTIGKIDDCKRMSKYDDLRPTTSDLLNSTLKYEEDHLTYRCPGTLQIEDHLTFPIAFRDNLWNATFICGGLVSREEKCQFSNACYYFHDKLYAWIKIHSPRFNEAMVGSTVSYFEGHPWITGGGTTIISEKMYSNPTKKTVCYNWLSKFDPCPDLPEPLMGHCLQQITEESYFLLPVNVTDYYYIGTKVYNETGHANLDWRKVYAQLPVIKENHWNSAHPPIMKCAMTDSGKILAMANAARGNNAMIIDTCTEPFNIQIIDPPEKKFSRGILKNPLTGKVYVVSAHNSPGRIQHTIQEFHEDGPIYFSIVSEFRHALDYLTHFVTLPVVTKYDYQFG